MAHLAARRDATRVGVNFAALPRKRGRGGSFWIDEHGDRAIVEVVSPAGRARIDLVKLDGRWRIDLPQYGK